MGLFTYYVIIWDLKNDTRPTGPPNPEIVAATLTESQGDKIIPIGGKDAEAVALVCVQKCSNGVR